MTSSSLRPTPLPDPAAILLAAGAGKRLGYPKAALTLAGRWMLPTLVAAFQGGGCSRVVLVLSEASRAAIEPLGKHGAPLVALNADPEAGRTGSILAGLAALDAIGVRPDPLLIHPCDVPLLSADAVATLLADYLDPRHAADCLRPMTPARRGGHPLLLSPNAQAALRTFGPDKSLRHLLTHPDLEQRASILRGQPGLFLDVDTPEQAAFLASLLENPS